MYPICIFEDEFYSRLYPLTLTRPVFELRCGMLTLQEKIREIYPDHTISFACRDYLQEVVRQGHPETSVNDSSGGPCLFLNGRALVDSKLKDYLGPSGDRLFVHDGQLVAAFLSGALAAKMRAGSTDTRNLLQRGSLDVSEVKEAQFIDYPWDLIARNHSEIIRDFNNKRIAQQPGETAHPGAILLNSKDICIGEDSVIKAGAVLDAEDGPIYVGKDVTIMSNAVVQGPVCIGDNSVIKAGAKIYEGTSIGPNCKVGGEVESSVLHAYSNKQHDGFLGHSYLGEWVNLGAGTNNSDLKNNYGSIKVPINGELVDSGSMFVGLFMADHAKTGINTMFNTGSVVGVMSNVFGAGFPPKSVPSFSWGGYDGFVEYDLDKGLETAEQVLARRKKKLSNEVRQLLRHLFEVTRAERNFDSSG